MLARIIYWTKERTDGPTSKQKKQTDCQKKKEKKKKRNKEIKKYRQRNTDKGIQTKEYKQII
jgi:hypothetical protein